MSSVLPCAVFHSRYDTFVLDTLVGFGATITPVAQNVARATFRPCWYNISEAFSTDFSGLEKIKGTHVCVVPLSFPAFRHFRQDDASCNNGNIYREGKDFVSECLCVHVCTAHVSLKWSLKVHMYVWALNETFQEIHSACVPKKDAISTF